MPRIGVSRESIEEVVKQAFNNIKKDRKVINNIKDELIENGIKAGDFQYILTGRIPLEELDMKKLCLLMVKLSKYVNLENGVTPQTFFTEQEIKDAVSMQIVEEPPITLPYTFENVIYIREGNYSTVITAQEIKKLMDSKLLTYNPETQREGRVEKDEDGRIVFKPKTIKRSVDEIAELFENDELETTTLTFNARVGTADSGEELIYDSKNKTLTITKGTSIDILDGYHRISGIMKVLNKYPDKDMTFDLKILNYTVKKALKYFNQTNKRNLISLSRRRETDLNNMSTVTFDFLKDECDFLKGRISSNDQVLKSADQLVTSKVLIDAIEAHYKPSDRIEAKEIAFYLSDFFTALFTAYPEAFVRNIANVRENSLINANQMFDGYVLLSKRFKEENVPLENIKQVIDQVDFSKDNEMWKELGILSENKTINKRIVNKIREFFKELNIKEA
jgi:hypothetical protein